MKNKLIAKNVKDLLTQPIVSEIRKIAKEADNITTEKTHNQITPDDLLRPVFEFTHIEEIKVYELNQYAGYIREELMKTLDVLRKYPWYKHYSYSNKMVIREVLCSHIYGLLLEKQHDIKPSKYTIYDFLKLERIKDIIHEEIKSILLYYYFTNYADITNDNGISMKNFLSSELINNHMGFSERGINTYTMLISIHHRKKHNEEPFLYYKEIYDSSIFLKEAKSYLNKRLPYAMVFSIFNKIDDIEKVDAYIMSTKRNLSSELFNTKKQLVDGYFGVTKDIALLDELYEAILYVYKKHYLNYIYLLIKKIVSLKLKSEEDIRKMILLLNTIAEYNKEYKLYNYSLSEENIHLKRKLDENTEEDIYVTSDNIGVVTDSIFLDKINI